MEVIALLAALAAPDLPPANYSVAQLPVVTVAQSWSCSPRKTCSKITSCEEAMWYLENCSWGHKLDGDGMGKPCENLCGADN